MVETTDFKSGLIFCISSSITLIEIILLAVFSSIYGTASDIIFFTLFGVTKFLLYLFKTLYYWISSQNAKLVFKRFIHIFIFILIASFHSTICLGPLKGGWGWSLFGVYWGISLLGIIFSSIWANIPNILLTIVYTLMNLIILLPINILLKALNSSPCSYAFLITSAILYIISSILYNLKNSENIVVYTSFIFSISANFLLFWFLIKYLLFI